MPNFVHPHGGPYGTNDPLPHSELNALCDDMIKAPNFDEGSTHAPTSDIALSGSMGGGLLFADLFPFRGVIDPTGGLYFTSPVSGFLRTSTLTAFDVFGPMTHAGASAVVQWTTGGSATWATGTTLTLASGATANLTGATVVRGAMTFQKSGGPGTLDVEDDCTVTLQADCLVDVYTDLFKVKSGGQITFQSGALLASEAGSFGQWLGTWTQIGTMTFFGGALVVDGTSTMTAAAGSVVSLAGTVNLPGTTTFTSGEVPRLSPARPWTRHLRTIAAVTTAATPSAIVRFDVATSTTGPRLHMVSGIADVDAQAIFEFDPPPEGSTMATVTVQSLGLVSNPVSTLPKYRIIRWKGFDAPENMSTLTTDDHDGTGADWVTEHTTSLTVTAHATVDLAYRYGLRVLAALDGSSDTMSFELAAKITGTVAAITGK